MSNVEGQLKPSRTGTRNVFRGILRHENFILGVILAVIVAILAVITGGKTVRPNNVRNILAQSSTVGIAAIGQGFIILTANIDLSVGGVAMMVSVLGAGLSTRNLAQNLTGAPIPLNIVIPIMLFTALGVGALNGLSVTRLRMPALIVTLAMWQIARGVGFIFSRGESILQLPLRLEFLGHGAIGGVPVSVIIFISVAAVAYFVLYYTPFGKSVYAVGSNPVGSYLSGVKVNSVLLTVFMISGFLAGLAGVITVARSMAGSSNSALNLEINSIASVAVGGVSLFGGRGNLIGIILGVLIIGGINNGMIVGKLTPAFQDMIRGLVIFTAVAVDTLRKR